MTALPPIENPQLRFYKFDPSKRIMLPYYHDGVQCTSRFQSACTDYLEEVIDIVKELAPNPDYTFFARAVNRSMVKDGIQPNDVLNLDKSVRRDVPGRQILTWWGNESCYLAKRYDLIGGIPFLISASDEYHPPIPVDDSMIPWAYIRCVIHFTEHHVVRGE